MIIDVLSGNCERLAVPEGYLQLIVSQDLLHFADGHFCDLMPVDDRAGNECISVVKRLATDDPSCQRNNGNAGRNSALPTLIFSLYHILYFLVPIPVSNP